MYRATTHDIEITVEPFYLEEQSEPDESRYFWGYRVTIANLSKASVCLRSRYWKITDGAGKTEEVHGPGVVGEQPVIEPGDSYQYSSGCPLKTDSGMMVGSYQMQSANGEAFEVSIPAFSLDMPDSRRTLN
ncbi:ApaG protein [Paenochrobactrum gallinarii]|uniref:Protein ApaG n=1 Tax=Paenochrobactrum gallinarii TaxID=643673 RepID=A0A841LVK2_9HYPH|nr:Co2+/Mg2+ efflux protein ApaG [Paenochrobactrum gallinarii]MBB6260527.1 ApaG protein [Paenochrobactrum gallinarii]